MASWPGACTFADVWERAVSSRPEQLVLLFERPGPESSPAGRHHISEWTYAEFDVKVAQVAHALRRAGVGQGSAVHLALTNSP